MGQKKNEFLQLKTSEIYYVTSADNYVEIVHILHSRMNKKLLRGTLKKVENQLHNSPVVRCHRSYLVNLHKVRSITGNAQGHSIHLRDINVTIPISRSYANQVFAAIEKL